MDTTWSAVTRMFHELLMDAMQAGREDRAFLLTVLLVSFRRIETLLRESAHHAPRATGGAHG